MAAMKQRQLNPLLEELREDVDLPKPPDISSIVEDLKTTPKIHAAYLYYTQEGCLVLQEMCIRLSATVRCNGWEEFGIKLGLHPMLIKTMKSNFQRDDPATNIFLAYVQKDDATIEEIINTLYEIQRHDILLKIHKLVRTICDTVLMKCKMDYNKDILKPITAPDCPFIFKNFKNTKKLTLETLQKSTPIIQEPQQKNSNRYAKTILLTYSYDANEVVEQLLVELRKPRGNLKLGILVLNEHRHKLNICPEQFILESFSQVDYVFPIITPQYIKKVMSNTTDINVSCSENPDHKYVKYIYRLMNTYYLRNGCRNTTVRCLIPDDVAKYVLKHSIMNHSLFQIWERINEVNALIDEILELKIIQNCNTYNNK